MGMPCDWHEYDMGKARDGMGMAWEWHVNGMEMAWEWHGNGKSIALR